MLLRLFRAIAETLSALLSFRGCGLSYQSIVSELSYKRRIVRRYANLLSAAQPLQ